MSTGNSPSGFDDAFPEEDLVLPDDLRDELARPLGDIVQENALDALLEGSERVIGVGDVVTVTLLRRGIEPDVAVFDYRTRRANADAMKDLVGRMSGVLVRVENPPGMITRALWRAVRDAARGTERVRIEVAGEEDLASLVAIATAPAGAHVIYGLPQQGLAVVRVDVSTRAFAVAAIRRMRR
ncbi:MAG: DUF359 domain-containing protein [Methanobacteriota archaeon]|nr:MAG: DUF359 domain-containing protein [Euryarchaeota archaeon]